MNPPTTIWRNRNFVIIALAEAISNIGLWFVILTNLEFLQRLVSSDFLKSLVLVSGGVLAILAAPKAGVMIDRGSKKNIIFWASLMQAISVAVMILAASMGSVILMVVAIMITSVANAFFIPALQSVIPLIVEKENFLHSNAVFMNISTMTRIGGTAITGILLTVLPLYGMYILTFVLYVVMTILRSFLRFDESQEVTGQSEQQENKPNVSFFEVFTIFRKHPELIITLSGITLIMMFLGGFNLLVIGFSESLHDSTIKSWIYTVEGIFVLLGGIASNRMPKNGDLLQRNVLFIGLMSIALFLMHFVGERWIILSGYALFGFSVGIWFPTYGTIPQLIISADIRGRYFSFTQMWNQIMSQSALVITGAMLDLVGLRAHMLILFGALALGFVLMFSFIRRQNLSVIQPSAVPHPPSTP